MLLEGAAWLLAGLVPLAVALHDAGQAHWQDARRALLVALLASAGRVAWLLWGNAWIPYW